MREVRRIPPHAVDRPALRGQLDVGMGSPLSLIVAPAGAGKTVLLSQWAQSRADIAVAWFDITSADGEPKAFAARLVSGISAVAPAFRAPSTPVEASQRRLGEAFLEDLAGGLGDAGTVVLVFDDLDRISGTPLLADLWRLVDLLPESAHAVFSSRVDLQLGWSRHRLEHGLIEIRQRELAFDDATTARVIERIAGKSVTEKAVATVTARTEGWAVGVQLTALTLRFSTDPERTVGTFADTDRLVVDYLSEEVLDALEPERRDALIRLAVLDEICAGLSEAVAGVDGASFIAALERDSMFLVAVPERPGWYRFHRLFRDLLRYRLRAADSRAEHRLLEAAADWFLAEGDGHNAVEYLLRARRWERVTDRVLASGREVFEEVRATTLAQWLDRVPSEVRATNPDVELLRAIVEGMSGHGAVAVDVLRALLAGGSLSVGQRQVALAYVAACVQFRPHPESFVLAAEEALALLAEHPDAATPDLLGLTAHPLLTYMARGSLGRAHLFLGDFDQARAAFAEASATTAFAYGPFRIHVLGSIALTDALSGRLTSAAGRADEALRMAREAGLLAHPAPADAYLARALVAIQRGEPDVGAISLAEGELRASANQRTQLMWVAHLVSLLADPASDRDEQPIEPPGPPPPLVRRALAALAMRTARLEGTPVLPSGPPGAWSPVAFEEVAALLTHGQHGVARARLGQLRFDPDPLHPLASVEIEILLGWLSALENRRPRARDHLGNALAIAGAEGIVDPFMRAGPFVADLIEELVGPPTEFSRLVVSRARSGVVVRSRSLIDDLTPRELELLAFLPSRLTIADIAVRCFVSTNTVKTHLGHIYRKLGVSGRDAAIDRAVELGLMAPKEIARVG